MLANYKPNSHIATTLIEYEGKALLLKDWCYLLDLDYTTVRMRYTRGMEVPELFAPTPRKFNSGARTVVLSDSIFERLEHHGKRLRIMPNDLVAELLKHGLNKLDKSEQHSKGE
jgi:hypothetical protein